jgi:hypothetical protein
MDRGVGEVGGWNFGFFRSSSSSSSTTGSNKNSNNDQNPPTEPNNSGLIPLSPPSKRKFIFPSFFSKRQRPEENPSLTLLNLNDQNEKDEASSGSINSSSSSLSSRRHRKDDLPDIGSTALVERRNNPNNPINRRGKRRKSPPLSSQANEASPSIPDHSNDLDAPVSDGPKYNELLAKQRRGRPRKDKKTLFFDKTVAIQNDFLRMAPKVYNTRIKTATSWSNDVNDDQFAFTTSDEGDVPLKSKARRCPTVRITAKTRKVTTTIPLSSSVSRDGATNNRSPLPSRRRKKNNGRGKSETRPMMTQDDLENSNDAPSDPNCLMQRGAGDETLQHFESLKDSPSNSTSLNQPRTEGNEKQQLLENPTDAPAVMGILKKLGADALSLARDIVHEGSNSDRQERDENVGGSQTQVGATAWTIQNGSVEKSSKDEFNTVNKASLERSNSNYRSPHSNSDVETGNDRMNHESDGTFTKLVESELEHPAKPSPNNKSNSHEFVVLTSSRLSCDINDNQDAADVAVGGEKLDKDIQSQNGSHIPSPTGSGTTRDGSSVASVDGYNKDSSERSHSISKLPKQPRPLFQNLAGTHQCETIRFDGVRCRYQTVGQSGHCSRHLSDEGSSNVPQFQRSLPPTVDQMPNATTVTETSSVSNSDNKRRRNVTEGTTHRMSGELSLELENKDPAGEDCDVNEGGPSDGETTNNTSTSVEDASEVNSVEVVSEAIDSKTESSRNKKVKQVVSSMDSFPRFLQSHASAMQDIQYLRNLACLNDRCVFVRDRRRCESQCIRGSVLCSLHDGKGLSSTSVALGNTFVNDSSSSDTAGTHSEPFVASKTTPLDTSSNVKSSNDSSSDDSSDNDSDTTSGTTSDTSDDDESHSQGQPRNSPSKSYTHSEFLSMWHRCEELFGEGTDEIESSRRVRASNQKMNPDDTDGQLKAQYGRLLPLGMKKMMEILDLRKDDVFLDVGHGIGNTCLHAAFCIGCVARGIEVVSGRHSIAEVFRDQLIAQNREASPSRDIGAIDLRLGRLEDRLHTEFLTKGVTKAYVNNFSGVFAERSSKNDQKWFLDDYVAGLFALLEPGAVMMTFHPLNLGLDKEAANEQRKKHNLSEHGDASFFAFEKLSLGKACKTVKWNLRSGNQTEIQVYKYTRLRQPHGEKAVFLCTNPQCPKAQNAEPIEATMENEEGRVVLAHCTCKFSPKNLRKLSKKVYVE